MATREENEAKAEELSEAVTESSEWGAITGDSSLDPMVSIDALRGVIHDAQTWIDTIANDHGIDL